MISKLILTLFYFFTTNASAQNLEDLAKLKPLEARAFLIQGQEVTPGSSVDLRIEVQVKPEFFVYGHRLKLSIKSPKQVNHGELFVDPLVEFTDVVSKKVKKGIKNKAEIKTILKIPESLGPQDTDLVMTLQYTACTTKFCLLPKDYPLHISIRPQLNESDSSFSKLTSTSTGDILDIIKTNLPLALLLIYIFGLLASFTPCIYPLIPITLTILGSRSQSSKLQSFALSLSYVLGIALVYALLGVLAAMTGQLFGSFISHPAVIIATSLIFFAMGLSLFGLFEFQWPAAIRNRLPQSSGQSGYLGAFVSGNLAGVIASPCVGPIVVGILTYITKTQDPYLGFLLLFVFALGFGTLFLVLGTFSQLLQKLPQSGGWMNGVKYLLGISMILLSIYYAWPLIKRSLPESSTQISTEKGVHWQKYSEEKVAQALQENKPILIDFFADWCFSCVELDKLTFTDPAIIELSKKFMMLKVDATNPSESLQVIEKKYSVYGLPTLIFIDKNGKVSKDLTLTGFEEAAPFLERMKKGLAL